MTNMEPLDALFDDGPPAEAPIAPQPPDGALRDLAARLPRTMRLGTSTWNFPGWRGIIWSRGSGLTGLAENGLTAYSKNPLLRTVGLDRNFYRALTTAHFAHYAAQVPEDFRFIVKAPREVTDPYERDDRGRPTGTNPLFLNAHAAVDKFLGPARLGLGRKAGPLVFQFSPVPHPELRTLEARIKLFERITTFLAELRAPGDGLLLAAECRNYELFTPRMMKRLRTLGVSPVIGLHPAMPGIRRQTEALRCWAGEFRESEAEQSGESDVFVPKASGSSIAPAAAADWNLPGPLVVRWSLAAHQFYDTAKQSWAPFDAIHAADPATRALIASLLVKAARSGQDSFLAVNNKAEGCAPKTVRGIAEIADRILEADRPVVR